MLVSIDTLRADRVGACGSTSGLTPNLDRFAASSITFRNAWAQANQTNLSHASLFTSRYPSELGAIANGFQPSLEMPALAEVLRIYGYHTAGFTGGGHLTEGLGLERGFSTWKSPQELGSFFHTLPQAVAWLDALPTDSTTPFLLFLHGFDSHERYLKPSPLGLSRVPQGYQGPAMELVRNELGAAAVVDGFVYNQMPFDLSRLRVHDAEAKDQLRRWAAGKTPFEAKDEAYVAGAYDGAVAYADGWFGVLLAELEDRDILERAIVVVLSDHGESLGENGIHGHSWSLTDNDLHVPLLIHLPGGEGGGRVVDGQVALIDVFPTLLELSGARMPAGIHGGSLLPWLRGEEGPSRPVVFSEGSQRMVSARSAAGRLTFSGVDANSPFLVDLLGFAPLDGPSFGDASTSDLSVRGALRQEMLSWRGELHPAEAFQHADPALVKTLQEHGYFEAQ